MNNIYSNEFILQNLFDYVNGTLKDDKLKQKIEFYLINDKEICAEYNKLKKTINLINKFEFISPPENYFQNLLPRINNRIDNITENKNRYSISLKKFCLRYLIPVMPLLLLFFIFKTIIINKYDNEDLHKIISKDYAILDSNINIKSETETDSTEIIIVPDKNQNDNVNIKHEHKNKTNKENIITNSNESDIIDIFSYEEDDFNDVELDFFEFTNEQQKIILNNLQNESL
jgi:hypothetical protein